MKYEKVGCFKDKRNARALSEKIFNDRKNIDWEAGKWEKFLKRQVLEEYNSLYFHNEVHVKGVGVLWLKF